MLSRSALALRRVRPALVLRATGSTWAHVPQGPPDPILGLTVAYNNDTDPNKVSLGVGAYRDDSGKPFVLKSVHQAEKTMLEDPNLDMEYAGIDGVPKFVSLARELAFGKSHPLVQQGLIASVQTLSGTGALRLATEWLNRFAPGKKVYIPNPTWANHKPIIKDSGLDFVEYTYYKRELNGLDFDGMVADIKAAPEGSVILLHACAHNPTGVDPTLEQWKGVSQACKERGHIIFFDSAYQGFASGDPDHDSLSYRTFIEDGHQIILCQSFAKNMGLYGMRTGAFHVTCATAEEQKAVLSQLKILIRPMYSNPPVHGARIAAQLMGNPELNTLWRSELKGMADRINEMRHELVKHLKESGSTKDWTHVTDQIGMFCYTGLTPEQVLVCREKEHVYMTNDGRISIAGLNSKNVAHVARAIHEASK